MTGPCDSIVVSCENRYGAVLEYALRVADLPARSGKFRLCSFGHFARSSFFWEVENHVAQQSSVRFHTD
jgi:hypothetical protein